MVLAYVLKGRQLDFRDARLLEEWEIVKQEHEVELQRMQLIEEAELKLGERIGRGGGGDVYRAQWNGGRVAVKQQMRPTSAELGLEDFADFWKEISIQASLNDPHVTPMYAATRSGWLVMELADGNLMKLCKRHRGQWPWSTKLKLAKQAAAALRYLHSRTPPANHRDVKSQNFLVFGGDPKDCILKIADFGLTDFVRHTRSSLTTTQPGGTLEWQAPEPCNDLPITLASDIFSLGVVMFEIVTGCHPYATEAGDYSTPFAVMKMKLGERDPCPSSPRDCPSAMLALMRRCIAVNTKSRPDSRALCSALDELPDDWVYEC
eukprot:evm.model.scf_233.3 EVM.evm.TU.scf_233.3   scf_233:72593-73552(+)